MWLPRQLDAIERGTNPLVLSGGEPYGVPFVIDALCERQRVAWVGVPPRVSGDAVGQGNALASAVNGVLTAPFLPHALPYRAHLQALRRHGADLLPLWIVASTAHVASDFVRDLLDLADAGYRLVLDVGDADVEELGAPEATVIGPDELRLTLAEARGIAPGAMSEAEVAQAHREAGGRFSPFVALAQQRSGLPTWRVPSPNGPLVDAAEAVAVEPAVAVLAMQREGEHVGALELAARHVPEMVEDLLRVAGPAYQESGLLRRLHLLLSAVPRPYARRERVLEWRLVAALAADDLAAVAPEVDAHLAIFEAPDLRARRAGTLPRPKGYPLAEGAAASKRTPLTLWQYGRMHPDPSRGIEILREAVQLAEDMGTAYDRARTAGALAARLLHLGEFARAGAWARWALDVFDKHHLRDGARRLAIYNDLAVARILSGDVAGLRRGLEDAQAAVDGNLPGVDAFVRSTLAYLELATGNGEAALDLVRASYDRSARVTRSRYAYQYVRALNEFGRYEEAMRVADEAVELSGAGFDHRRLAGQLARGMARAVAGAEGAVDDLIDVMHAHDLSAEQRITAALHHLLASGGAGHQVPADVAALMRQSNPMALRVLSGPATRFQETWDALATGGPGLRLEFLGTVGCRVDGVRIRLPLRLAEVALALALNPDGLSNGALNAFLSPDGARSLSKGSIRALVTRLRELIPVTEAPYRLAVPYVADVLDVRVRLATGDVREAIAMLRGPLLGESQAPGVEEQRAALEEELRQAVLLGRDVDALFDLADRFGDDLEIWEATADALVVGDPRLALARARVRRLQHEFAVRGA